VTRQLSPLESICVLTLVLAAGGTALADTATLGPVRDNTLYEDSAGSLSNGAGDHLFAGSTARGSVRRALLGFDVASRLPAGATVTGVSLTLHVSRTIAGSRAVALHRALSSWGEGTSDAFGEEGLGAESTPNDATWIHTFFNTEFWTTAGGDFAETPSATQSVDGPGFYTWASTPELVADVQMWLDDPSADFGWVVIGTEEPGAAKRFDSREIDDESLRPALEIEFAIPGSDECDPDPEGWGYWHRQCIAVPPGMGGLRPGRMGRGPRSVREPGFVNRVVPCVADRLNDLGFNATTCEAMGADPASDACNRSLRQLTALIANVCSGRLQNTCSIDWTGGACAAEIVGERIDEAAALIRSGMCHEAATCIREVTHGGGPTPTTRRISRQPRAWPTSP
jgi:hypothetical protein